MYDSSIAAVTRFRNKIEAELSKDKSDVHELEEHLDLFKLKIDLLKSIDNEIEEMSIPKSLTIVQKFTYLKTRCYRQTGTAWLR